MSRKTKRPEPLAIERVPTGIPGLDTVLNGGLVKGGVYIIAGTPGAGKTILGNQMCFNTVARGGKALFVTILAESNARMMLHIGGMSFFNEQAIPGAIYYVSAFGALQTDGLKGVLDVVRREVRSQEATLLVVDGLVAIEERASSDEEFKRFIHELQTQSALSGCTTVLLTSGGARETRPEQTMVDGLLYLKDVPDGQRRERRLEASKMRGGGHLRGEHAFEITDEGIVVYPRIEALYARPSGEGLRDNRRLSTGVPELDMLIKGGLPVGSTTMLLGPPGSGKTTLGLHFLSQSTPKERALYLGFYEPPEQACKKADLLNLPLRKLVGKDVVRIVWFPQTENILDELGHAILSNAQEMDAKRIFLDGMGGFQHSTAAPDRLLRFMGALANETRAQGRTVIYTHDRPELPAGMSSILENYFEMSMSHEGGVLQRWLRVVKVRDSDFEPTVQPYVLSDGGIRLSAQQTARKKK